MPMLGHKGRIAAAAMAAAFSLPAAVAAQQFPAFGGFDGRIGFAAPDATSTGFTASVDADLGWYGITLLRVIAGVNHFSSNVDQRRFADVLTDGSISATGGRVGLRLDLLGSAVISPSLVVAITGHNVTVDADLPEHRELLDREFGGFQVGAAFGGGAMYSLDVERRFRVAAEVRRVVMPNMSHWAGEVGIRVVPWGRQAHIRIPADPWRRAAAIARTDAERVRLERELAEAERRRLEQERLRAGRPEIPLADDREREAALREAEEARRRAAIAEEEARRAREEREAAEREAERLRTEAAAAERRALEAEDRLYRALLDLDRLITNVTEIRETDRGLAIVLGQGLFAVGQHTLSPRARDEVGRIAAVLNQYSEHPISVEGHTDSTGSASLNQRLSEQRAEAVRSALIAQGIDPNRVTTVGFGQDRPIADNATAAGRTLNRRVEMVLVGAYRPAAL